MKCPKCQNENREEAMFCDKCGHQLSSSSMPSPQVPSIDEKIDKIQRYLPKGLTDKILAQRGKIEGENKQVTVMFCDMEGFTPLVEKLGSERAYSVMDEVYEILIHKVHDFEGTVNEMTGDGIMALFGAPIALEDAPQRALRSALAIHREIANFNGNREGIDPIKMRIGIRTGPVVVGTLGNDLRVEFKAVGDTVNLASRMEGLADPGTTCVTEGTLKLTDGLFLFEALGEKEVKGKESNVPVYKLLAAKKDVHRPRLGHERSIYSEMVGRDKELGLLELQVLKATNGEGSIVNIKGEAGIGKSRLMAELKNREVMKRVFLLEGRTISTGRNLSFHPIIGLLKLWAHIGEDDNGVVAFNKLDNAIRKVAPEDLDEILPFVATLMGLKLSGRYAERVKGIEGEALEKLILKNIRDLIIKATEMKPHVVVMEDLHWADTSSIELMESLFRLANSQRIIFINVFRPGYKETGDRIDENLKEKAEVYHVEINLQPLDESMSKTLIHNMLQIKGLKHTVIDQIIERADGNPFFIEEVVRSFIDHGAVVQKEGAFEVTDKINAVVIPHTINDVLMARIDQLDEKTRELVKIASVIGRSFFYRILKEMTKTIEDVDNRLSHLQEIQLFREQKRMDEVEYLFKHALAQEAAYKSILHQTRMDLHIKVANSIESVFKERLHEFYGMLAYHYSKGEDLDKAEEYMIKAGEEALGSSASSEALHYYNDALDLYLKKYGDTSDPEKLAMLEKNIANAFFYKGKISDALIYYDRALKRLGIKPTQNKLIMMIKFLFDALIVFLNVYFPSKKSRKVPSTRDRFFFDLCRNKDVVLVSLDPMRCSVEVLATTKKILKFNLTMIESGYVTLLSCGGIFLFSGISMRLGNKILSYGERFIDKNNHKEHFDLILFRTLEANCTGKKLDILDFDELLIDENLKFGRFSDVVDYFSMYLGVMIYQGKFNHVYQLLKKLKKIADDYDNQYAMKAQLIYRIKISLECRKLNDALKNVNNFESIFSIGSDTWSIFFLDLKVQLKILLDDKIEAERVLNQVEDIYGKQPFIFPFFEMYHSETRALWEYSCLEESILSHNNSNTLKYRRMAGKTFKKIYLKISKKVFFSNTDAFRLVGQYYWQIDKQNRAIKLWKKSIKEGERLGSRHALARTYMEIGKRFTEENSRYKELNGVSAEEYLDWARTMFQEMDLQWDLDELDKITMTD